MTKPVGFWVVAGVTLLLTLPGDLTPWSSGKQGQSAEAEKTAVLNAIMTHRLVWSIGGSAMFAACDAFNATDRPAAFPEGLDFASELLQAASPPCPSEAPATPRVHVRAIELMGDSARAELTVVNRNGAYREDIQLVRRSETGYRVVRSIEHTFVNR